MKDTASDYEKKIKDAEHRLNNQHKEIQSL